jgi:cell division protein FtsQ
MGVALKFPQFRSRSDDGAGKAERRRQSKKAAPRSRVDSAKQQSQTRRAAKAQTSKGATRHVQAAVEKAPKNFAWLNRILILLGAGVVMIAGLQAYITLQSIPVQRITVTGELEHTRTSAVQEMVQPALSGGFLGADLQQVRQQLEALPWIYEASVRRVWPNALEIHVVEQLPIARWGQGAFLNHEGEVFTPSNRSAWQSLPLLAGPAGEAKALIHTYQRVVDMLAPLGLSIEQLLIDERGQVEAVLEHGPRLMIGGDEFLERMQRFMVIYRAELAPQLDQIERIDLRYQRGIAVAFKDMPQQVES